MSHTPGRWERVGRRDIVAEHEGVPGILVAEVWIGRPEAEDNARLIAAAPDLLDVVEHLLAAGIGSPAHEAMARVAIAKATGQEIRT